jgi:SAM-dependent methyltransferase
MAIFCAKINRQKRKRNRHPTYYEFIATDVLKFQHRLEKVLDLMSRKSPADVSFLDVGCGYGNVLLTAILTHDRWRTKKYGKDWARKNAAYMTVNGIERCVSYIRVTKDMMHKWSPAIFRVNALKFDRYGKYDIIHMYHPIRDRKLQGSLERKVENEAKVGAYLIVALKADDSIKKDPRFRRLPSCEGGRMSKNDYQVYRKVRV